MHPLHKSWAYSLVRTRERLTLRPQRARPSKLSAHPERYCGISHSCGPHTPGEFHNTREFVVGTGGGGLTTVVNVQPNSEVRISGTFGVLRLILQPTSYSWRFIAARGGTATDSGSANCH